MNRVFGPYAIAEAAGLTYTEETDWKVTKLVLWS